MSWSWESGRSSFITLIPSPWSMNPQYLLKVCFLCRQAHSKQLLGPPRNSGRHHCTYWEIWTTINGQQTDPGLNLQLNRLGFILTYSTNKSMVEERYALKASKVSITHCLKRKGRLMLTHFCPYIFLPILRDCNLNKYNPTVPCLIMEKIFIKRFSWELLCATNRGFVWLNFMVIWNIISNLDFVLVFFQVNCLRSQHYNEISLHCYLAVNFFKSVNNM